MQLQIITIYVVCDTYLKQQGHREHPQARMTKADVMTTALVAAWRFHGNLRWACETLRDEGYIPAMLGESRVNRRLHTVSYDDWQGVLPMLAQQRLETTFVIDSCPVPVCQAVRAPRRKLYHAPNAALAGDAYKGYCAAKDEWDYALKGHVVVDASGRPVEVLPLCGCSADRTGMKEMTSDLPDGAELYGDKAYHDDSYEEPLQQEQHLTLLPIRKSNSKRPHKAETAARIRRVRKRIETTFSQINSWLARRIAAVTDAGFESKIMATFVAYAIVGVAS